MIVEADGRAVPDHVDPIMRVEEESSLLGSRRSAGDRIEPARAKVLHVLQGDHLIGLSFLGSSI